MVVSEVFPNEEGLTQLESWDIVLVTTTGSRNRQKRMVCVEPLWLSNSDDNKKT